MKLIYLFGLMLMSSASAAVDLQIKDSKKESIAETADVTVISNWFASRFANAKLIAFSPFGNDHPLIIGSGTFKQRDALNQRTPFTPHLIKGNTDSGGYFTEFQFVIRQNLLLTGNWTRINQSNTYNHNDHRTLKWSKWNLTSDRRPLTTKTLGINWHIDGGWGAYAKLQTVSGSAWIPQLSIPSYISQDLENRTLGAVGVVYQF